MEGWVAFGVSGWIACALVVWLNRKPKGDNIEKQLQETAREFAAQRRQWVVAQQSHEAQMDAIRSDIVEFELRKSEADPEAVRAFLARLLSKTKKRGERG